MSAGKSCQGILGKMFGHKFVKTVGGYIYRSDFCWRCGMPKGGWT